MKLFLDILELFVAAVLGFFGGQLSIWAANRKPDWRVSPTGVTDYPTASATPRPNTFIVTNLGGTAYNVTMTVGGGGTLARGLNRSTFERNDDEMVNSAIQGDSYIYISWKTRWGRARGPVKRFMAPKK